MATPTKGIKVGPQAPMPAPTAPAGKKIAPTDANPTEVTPLTGKG